VRDAAYLIGGVVLIFSLASGQSVTPKVEQWNTIDRLCGALLHVERHVSRENVIEERTRALKNVVLKLYERDNVACCEGAKVLADVTTGGGGKFSFKNLKPGSYWLIRSSAAENTKCRCDFNLEAT